MNSREALTMAYELGRMGIAGFDLVEVSPSWLAPEYPLVEGLCLSILCERWL